MNKKIIYLFGFLFLFSCQPFDQQKQNFLYNQLSDNQTHITFSNTLNETEAFNIIEYLYYYNGGGIAVGDLNNDDLPDIYFTANQSPNELYLNKGNLSFENITEQAGVSGEGDWKTGVNMVDVNGDGWLDIYVCQVGDYKTVKGRNQLFINSGNNQNGIPTFTEKAAEYGLDFQGFSTQSAFFDYDLDGDLDMFLLNHTVHSPDNYSNIKIRESRDSLSGDRLYRNDSQGNSPKFTDITYEAGIISSKIGYGLSVTLSDIDGNGCSDIYVGNDFHENDYLYYNNCDGTFSEKITASVGHTSTFTMGNDVADVNNDGLPDILSLDMKPEEELVLKSSAGADPYNIYAFKLEFGYHYQFPRNVLQINQGNLFEKAHQFSEVGQLAGLAATDWSWSVLLHDMDNDGWKDAFITNGIWRRPNDLDFQRYVSNRQIQKSASNLELAEKMPSGIVPNYAFKNKGIPKNSTVVVQYEDVSSSWGLDIKGCSNGAAYADLDNDGDLDLIVNNLNDKATVFENKADEINKNNWLKIRLKGMQSNTFGIGTKVVLKVDERVLLQEQFPVRGFQSCVEPVLHFGLGKIEKIDTLIAFWPSGKVTKMTNVAANQMLSLDEKNSNEAEIAATLNKASNKDILLKELPFKHQEDSFTDFNREKLIPHQLTTEGPCFAIGDINNDSLEDIFIGGAHQQSGVIFIQTKTGDFTQKSQTALEDDSQKEDVAASFFDADGDGDLDLYVVSGGGRFFQNEMLQDRLYINDGNGNFELAKESLPSFFENGSCVLTADFNQDGAIDLLVGTRSIVGSYGLSPSSYLLLNDGKGHFSDQTQDLAPELKALGMVTDAALLPTGNKNAAPSLVLVGEWMPITIFEYQNGQYKKRELPNTSGWWNVVKVADLDGDGDQDILAGNLGLNSDLQTSQKEPVGLYVKDFDGNNSTDPILTYYKQGKPYTYSSQDELIGQVVALRKRFRNYSSFARSTLPNVFNDKDLEGAVYKEVQTFASAWFENTGGGDFDMHPLPLDAQIAPIQDFVLHDFNGDGNIDIFAAGNFYGFKPAIGKMDASFGSLLIGDKTGTFKAVAHQKHNLQINGEVREMVKVKLGSGTPAIVIGRNNETVQILEWSRPTN